VVTRHGVDDVQKRVMSHESVSKGPVDNGLDAGTDGEVSSDGMPNPTRVVFVYSSHRDRFA
jgi:hypothetical protein